MITPQYIVDIINKEMSMPADSVWIRTQNRQIPNDNGLYIVVGSRSFKTSSNVAELIEKTVDSVVETFQSSQVATFEQVQIDILSRSNDALFRRQEIVMALQSFYAQQQMELNQFKIFRIPSEFVDTSSAEGGSELNRYTIVFATMAIYRKDKPLDYYDDFPARVDDEQTINTENPLIEFEITAE